MEFCAGDLEWGAGRFVLVSGPFWGAPGENFGVPDEFGCVLDGWLVVPDEFAIISDAFLFIPNEFAVVPDETELVPEDFVGDPDDFLLTPDAG